MNAHHQKPPPDATWVSIRVLARIPHEVPELALELLDQLRGVWTLALTKGVLRTWSGTPRPLGPLLVGPIHTVHAPDGTAPVDTYWYRLGYVGVTADRLLEEHWQQVLEATAQVRRSLARLTYREAILEALGRYARALDEVDMDVSSLKLWGVLERLTFTGRARFDTTIRRASFIYKRPELHQQELAHLRTYRNRLVHSDITSRDRQAVACSIKRYVEDLLLFHIHEGPDFQEASQVEAFLDLPSSPKLLRRAVRFIK